MFLHELPLLYCSVEDGAKEKLWLKLHFFFICVSVLFLINYLYCWTANKSNSSLHGYELVPN
jgi:hypothetical protein